MSLFGDSVMRRPPPESTPSDPRTTTDGSFTEFIVVPVDNDQGSLAPSNLRTNTDFSFGAPVNP